MGLVVASFKRATQNPAILVDKVVRFNYCLLINSMFSDPWHSVRANKYCVTANWEW